MSLSALGDDHIVARVPLSLSGLPVPTIVAFCPAQVSAAPQFSDVRTSAAAEVS